MLVDNIEVVSINDCLRVMCFPNNLKASITTFFSKISRLVDKHLYQNARCYRADAEDKTKHILLELDLIFMVLADQEFTEHLKNKAFDSSLLSKNFFNLEAVCCCNSKKLKKAMTFSESFSDFVKAGPVVLNSFNAMKSKLNRVVCLDIEGKEYTFNSVCFLMKCIAFEHDHRKILEVGLVVLNLHSWTEEAHHVIITEYEFFFNGKYVCNNKDKFNFGTSKKMSLAAAIDFIVKHLNEPASCLLGHNIKSDINFLRQFSSQKLTLPVFDTQAIFNYHSLSQEPASLARVLDHLSIPYSNLHNAGNDAYYTLKAFMRMAQLDQ